jgi:hypothetical protein
MRDPLGELRNLAGNLTPQPLPAEEVRRRGDRLRRRRTLVQAVGAAAAVAAVVSGGAFVTGNLSTTPVPPGPAEQSSSPAPSPTADLSRQAWLTGIPDDVSLTRGLPEAGGDVPDWEWAEGPDTPLSAIACGENEPLPARPVDGLRVTVAPPDESRWRHLLLFEDAATAAEALRDLLSSAGQCSEGPQGVPEDQLGPEQVRWTFSETLQGRTSIIDVEGAFYARGTDTRVPGRILARAVQVGNALLVARLDTASSTSGPDADARAFASDVEGIAAQMCVFAADPCQDAPPPERSSSAPTPE